jgi:UDP-GlcNAc:undecaprenyl-phosphate GlcNAc-1-phosphate transferase
MSVLRTSLVSLVVTVVVMPVLILLLRRRGVLDRPNERSSHTTVTVRGAGVAVAIGAGVGIASWGSGESGRWWLVCCPVLFAAVGFLDDLRSLSPKLRLLTQVALSVTAVVVAAQADVVSLSAIALAVASFGVVAYVNAFNFMDGINGISGVQAVVAGGGLAIAGAGVGSSLVEGGGLVIAAASLGFLPFNVPKARAFLGDVGSYFIGAWIALLSVLAFGRGVGFPCVLGVVIVYAADTVYTLARRIARSEDWWSAHRQHVYQRLTDSGLSHVSVAMIVAGFSIVAVGIGLSAIGRSAAFAVFAVIGELTVAAAYLATPRLVSMRRTYG